MPISQSESPSGLPTFAVSRGASPSACSSTSAATRRSRRARSAGFTARQAGYAARAAATARSVSSTPERSSCAIERSVAGLRTSKGPKRSAALEDPFALVAGDHLVELRLLCARVVEVVVDHIVAKSLPRHRPLLQRSDGITQCVRESLHIRFVSIACERGPKLELLLDAVEAGGDQRSDGEVRVHVCSRDARFGAQVLAVTDNPEPARPVVVAPGQRRGRP